MERDTRHLVGPDLIQRRAVLLAVANMPDESWGYLILALIELRERYAKHGGFHPESRASFESVGAAACAYLDSHS